MLTIHDKVPVDMEYVKDNEHYFRENTFTLLDERAQVVIGDIDHGTNMRLPNYTGRLGVVTSILDLSTGCKTALNVMYSPSTCFDLIECGANAVGYILGMQTGNVLIQSGVLFSGLATSGVNWRGRRVCTSALDLANLCEEVWPTYED